MKNKINWFSCWILCPMGQWGTVASRRSEGPACPARPMRPQEPRRWGLQEGACTWCFVPNSSRNERSFYFLFSCWILCPMGQLCISVAVQKLNLLLHLISQLQMDGPPFLSTGEGNELAVWHAGSFIHWPATSSVSGSLFLLLLSPFADCSKWILM